MSHFLSRTEILSNRATNLFVHTASKIDRHLLSTVGSTGGFFLFTKTVNYKVRFREFSGKSVNVSACI